MQLAVIMDCEHLYQLWKIRLRQEVKCSEGVAVGVVIISQAGYWLQFKFTI